MKQDLDKKTFNAHKAGLVFSLADRKNFYDSITEDDLRNVNNLEISRVLDTFHEKLKSDHEQHVIAACSQYLERDLTDSDLEDFKLRYSQKTFNEQFLLYKNKIIGIYTTEPFQPKTDGLDFKIGMVTNFKFI